MLAHLGDFSSATLPAWEEDESAAKPSGWELIINFPHFCPPQDSASYLSPLTGTVWGTTNLGDGKAIRFLNYGVILLSLVGLFSINLHLLSFAI